MRKDQHPKFALRWRLPEGKPGTKWLSLLMTLGTMPKVLRMIKTTGKHLLPSVLYRGPNNDNDTCGFIIFEEVEFHFVLVLIVICPEPLRIDCSQI